MGRLQIKELYHLVGLYIKKYQLLYEGQGMKKLK